MYLTEDYRNARATESSREILHLWQEETFEFLRKNGSRFWVLELSLTRMPAGAPRSPKALIDRDFVPNPTQGREAPLRIPTLVATRPRLILTLDLLKFPLIRGSPPAGGFIRLGPAPDPAQGTGWEVLARLAKTLKNPKLVASLPRSILTILWVGNQVLF